MTTTPYVGTCVDCEERRETNDPNEVVRFYRRHRAVTGHDVVWEQTPSDHGTTNVDTDVPAVVASLVTNPDEGVSLGALSAVMSELGWTVGETLETVHDHRMRGALWEPQDDHVAAV